MTSPRRPAKGDGPALAAVVYDLIPLLFQDRYLRLWPGTSFTRRYHWALERLRTYDLLLAISEATRGDVIRVLNAPPEKVVTIGAAGDDQGAAFDPGSDSDLADLDALRALAVTGPFVFSVAPSDPRKNLAGLVDAFALLPESLRSTHGLVVAVGADGEEVAAVRRRAEALGVLGAVHLLTRPVDDLTLRALYRRCAAFAFPSLYEGFGLPILEALRCGAAVVAGDNSSQPEVAGDAAVLVNTADPAALAAALARVLTDEALARSLREKGPERARRFSWDDVAGRTLESLRRAGSIPRDLKTPGRACPKTTRPRPRIAFVSPLPPSPSGVATYAAALVDALGELYAIDLFHDTREFPLARFRSREFGCFDYRLFSQLDRVRPYHAIVYQMGNSPWHFFVDEMLRASNKSLSPPYEGGAGGGALGVSEPKKATPPNPPFVRGGVLLDALREHPGVLVLHDLALGSFHYERAVRLGGGLDAFHRALLESHPDRAEELGRHLAGWTDAPLAMVRGLTDAGFDMNRGVTARAKSVIVHSRGALERLGPEAAGKAFVVPHGADPVARREPLAARARLGLPADALVVGSFGIVHPSKLNAEAIEAFAALARSEPKAVFLVVGEEADGGLARRRAEELGLGDRVRFLGRSDDDGFLSLIAVTDVGVALRRPPTNGEASGALLDLLRSGVPSVVADTGSFAEFPEGVVRKVPWNDDAAGVRALTRALLDLAADRAGREALGLAAWNHVRDHHAWPRIAARYAAVIEQSVSLFRGPHHARARAVHRPGSHHDHERGAR